MINTYTANYFHYDINPYTSSAYRFMSAEELYYKLRLRSYNSFDEELVALVRCVSGGPRFEVVLIMENTLCLSYRNSVEVGHVFYSIMLQTPPTSKIRTVMSYWVYRGQEHYIGGHYDYVGDDATPNAELTPVTKEAVDLMLEEARLRVRLAEIQEALATVD